MYSCLQSVVFGLCLSWGPVLSPAGYNSLRLQGLFESLSAMDSTGTQSHLLGKITQKKKKLCMVGRYLTRLLA